MGPICLVISTPGGSPFYPVYPDSPGYPVPDTDSGTPGFDIPGSPIPGPPVYGIPGNPGFGIPRGLGYPHGFLGIR